MDRGGEPLETYILVPLPKHKNNEQKIKKAEEIIATSAPTVPEPLQEVEEVIEEPPPPSSPPVAMPRPPSPMPPVGKNQTQVYRKNQIKKILHNLKTRPEAESILQFENLDDLIKNSLSQSRKVLPNQEEFYRFMFDSGLSSLVRNRLAISKWYKKNWYFI